MASECQKLTPLACLPDNLSFFVGFRSIAIFILKLLYRSCFLQRIDTQFCHIYLCFFNIQEYWCKRLHPKNVCEKVFRQPPLRESLRKGKLRKQELALTKQKSALIQAADSIGQKIQYDCPGFLPNRRQVQWICMLLSLCPWLTNLIFVFLCFPWNPLSVDVYFPLYFCPNRLGKGFWPLIGPSSLIW